jgi:hypothetical protein
MMLLGKRQVPLFLRSVFTLFKLLEIQEFT